MRWLIVAGIAGIIGLAAAAQGVEQDPPRTYVAAVRRALDAQGVAYQTVTVVDGCAPTVQACRHYAGEVRIRGGAELRGSIACRRRWTACTLDIPAIGAKGVPLRDVRTESWRERIEALAGDAQDLLRGTKASLGIR